MKVRGHDGQEMIIEPKNTVPLHTLMQVAHRLKLGKEWPTASVATI